MAEEGSNVRADDAVATAEAEAAAPSTPSVANNGGEDGEVCRVCRVGDGRLYCPCLCSGSMKFIHQECLTEWLRVSGKDTCGLCGHKFVFQPRYTENAPQILPVRDVVSGLFREMKLYGQQLLRVVMILVGWFLFVPFLTARLFRLSTFHSWRSLQSVTNLEPSNMLFDMVIGCAVCFIIVMLLLGLFSLREFIFSNGMDVLDDPEDAFEIPPLQMDALMPRVEQDARGDAAAAPAPAPGPNAPPDVNAPAPQEGAPADDRGAATGVPLVPGTAAAAPAGPVVAAPDNAAQANNEVAADDPDAEGAEEGEPDDVLFGLFDQGDLGPEEIDFQELVGLTGPPLAAIENMVYAVIFNGIMLLLLVLVPLQIGRVWMLMCEISGSYLNDRLAHACVENSARVMPSVLIGYASLACTGLVFLGVTRVAPLRTWRFIREVRRSIRFVYSFVKVMLLIVLEMGIFPEMCGWAIDLCTLSMFNGTLESRRVLLRSSPVAALLLHWVVGMAFMFYFGQFLLLTREIVRPQVLWFLRDPTDPMFHPVKDMLSYSLPRHARRLVLSTLLYGAVIAATFLSPIQLIAQATSVFPLTFSLSDSISELPIDLLVFHVIIPFTLDRLVLRSNVKRFLKFWCNYAGRYLDVGWYLLPENNPNNRTTAERWFPLKVLGLLLSIWITLVCVFSAGLMVPLGLGRLVLDLVGLNVNEVYCFGVGFYCIWALSYVFRWALDTYRNNGRILALITRVIAACVTGLKVVALAVVWLACIPLLAGLLLDLIFTLPFRVAHDQSPVLFPFLFQSWIWGLIGFKVWVRIVLTDNRDTPLKRELESMKANGFNVDATRILTKFLLPIISILLACVCIPFVVVKGVICNTGMSHRTCSVIFQYSYLATSLFMFSVQGLISIVAWFHSLHRKIRDDKYKIGSELANCAVHARDLSPQPTDAVPPPESSAQ